MDWYVYLIVTIILIILGFVLKKSKILWYIQCFWIWILMAGSCGGVDWTVHNNIFLDSLNFKFLQQSWLYKLFCSPFVIRDMPFFYFNLCLSTILLFVLFYLIKKYSQNFCFVTSLIYIYPLADSIIQKRNFCALIFFLCGILPFLKKEKHGEFKFLFFTFLAAQIHMTYYLYFIIYPLMKIKKEKFNYFLGILLVIAFLIIPFVPNIATLLVGATKSNFYFSTLKIPFYQSCCWWALQIIFTFLFYKVLEVKKELNNHLNIDDTNDYDEQLIRLNKILLLFMPLYYYEPTFFRFFRNLLFVNYIYISRIFDNTSKKYVKVVEVVSITSLFVLLVFLSQFVFFGRGFDYLCVPIFEDNFFIGG